MCVCVGGGGGVSWHHLSAITAERSSPSFRYQYLGLMRSPYHFIRQTIDQLTNSPLPPPRLSLVSVCVFVCLSHPLFSGVPICLFVCLSLWIFPFSFSFSVCMLLSLLQFSHSLPCLRGSVRPCARDRDKSLTWSVLGSLEGCDYWTKIPVFSL